jgi:hypothetical protein
MQALNFSHIGKHFSFIHILDYGRYYNEHSIKGIRIRVFCFSVEFLYVKEGDWRR